MNIIIYHAQGFLQFITLIILSNIKENYSCSGLNYHMYLYKVEYYKNSECLLRTRTDISMHVYSLAIKF